MRKAKSLRDALEAALPELREDPARLIVWVEDGTVRTTQTGNFNFAIEYPLSIVIDQAKTDIAVITLAIVRWLQVEQPDLLAPNTDSFTFETDILDATTADIGFTLSLRENFRVTGDADAGWNIEPLAEPDPIFDDDLPVDGFTGTAPLTEAKLCDE